MLAATLGAGVTLAGCSPLIYYATSLRGSDTAPTPGLGLTRKDVEAKLGAPVSVTPLPDGGEVLTYEYRMKDQREMAKTLLDIHAGLVQVFGPGGLLFSALLEPLFTGFAIRDAVRGAPHEKVMFTFDPDGRLLHYGAPPSDGAWTIR